MKHLGDIRDKLNSLIRDSFVDTTEYKFLHHYTDLDSAKSIIEKGQFWVSDAFTTNDVNEIVHIRNVIKKVLLNNFQNRSAEIEDICLTYFDRACELIKKNTFILCFSLTKDSKPLWKDYAKRDSKIGVCMRFDFNTIKPNLLLELEVQKRVFMDANEHDVEVTLKVLDHRVFYSSKEKEDKIKEYLELVADVLERIDLDSFNTQLYEEELGLLCEIFTDILLFSFISKDSSWKDEEEYRMVFIFPDVSQCDSLLKIRKRGTLDIRYVSLSMKTNNTFSLSRIYVKSRNDVKYVKKSVKRYIAEDVKVKGI